MLSAWVHKIGRYLFRSHWAKRQCTDLNFLKNSNDFTISHRRQKGHGNEDINDAMKWDEINPIAIFHFGCTYLVVEFQARLNSQQLFTGAWCETLCACNILEELRLIL